MTFYPGTGPEPFMLDMSSRTWKGRPYSNFHPEKKHEESLGGCIFSLLKNTEISWGVEVKVGKTSTAPDLQSNGMKNWISDQWCYAFWIQNTWFLPTKVLSKGMPDLGMTSRIIDVSSLFHHTQRKKQQIRTLHVQYLKKNAITSPESFNSAPSQIPVYRELTGSRQYPWL